MPIPTNVQGRSLRPVLTGRTVTHRPQVFVEYAPNDEAAVRDERWKLIFERGKRRRTDGYDTGQPLPGRKIRLYDLESDPQELCDVASRPENADACSGCSRFWPSTSAQRPASRPPFQTPTTCLISSIP